MGLYGILVVTTPANGTTPAQAFPTVAALPVTSIAVSRYDADLPLVLSEIDPVQNASVAAAVGNGRILGNGGMEWPAERLRQPDVRGLQYLLPAGRELQSALLPRQRRVIRSDQNCVLHGANPRGARHREHGATSFCDSPRGTAHAHSRDRQPVDDIDRRRRATRCRASRASRTKFSWPPARPTTSEVKPTQAAGAYSAATSPPLRP